MASKGKTIALGLVTNRPENMMKRQGAKKTDKYSRMCSKDAPTNPRGIPFAPFVDKVEDYVSSREEVEGIMNKFQEMIA